MQRVVFPDSLLRLQIFEQRYLDMLSRQMASGENFGVCLIKKGQETGLSAEPHKIGVAVQIVGFEQQENGLLQIKCQGKQRFQINSLSKLPDNLLSANVSWLEPAEDRLIEQGQQELADLLQDLIKHPQVEILHSKENWGKLNFVLERLTEFMPINEPQKQAILEESNINLRTQMLYQILAWLK